VPRVPPNKKLRDKLGKEAVSKGPESIHNKLKKLDPKSAAKIHPNNTRYVIRAIEVNLATQKSTPTKKKNPNFDLFMIGINCPREELYKKINHRVDTQDQRGLIQEVKKLQNKGYDESLPSMSSLGVKEIIPYVKGEMPLADCLELLKRNTRRYAKRQMTWFRKYDNVKWLTPKEVEFYIKNA
jgi:tRNA dimethylallyltransferase